MIYQIVLSALALPTITHNNLFGNNNQIVVNAAAVVPSDASPPASPPPPSVTPLVDPYCPAIEETATLDLFPPMGAPAWFDPLDKPGLEGYSPDTYGLSGSVLIGREAYFSGAHLCTSAKVFADAMGDSGYGYPAPRTLVASGDKFMDEFTLFKGATAALPAGTDKTIRQTMVDATEGLVLIFRAKEVKSLELVGTRYYANLLFSTDSETVDASATSKHLYPIVPTFVENVERLVQMRIDVVNNTLSAYFGEDGAGSILAQHTSIIASAFNHAMGALTTLTQTGYTPEAAAAWRGIFNLDFVDKSLGDDAMQLVPSLTYDLARNPTSGNVEPRNFYTCAVALRMWEYMATIEAFGTKFVCTAPGAQILQAFSDLFTYELAAEGSVDASACSKPASWSVDLMGTVVYELSVSQLLANGVYGTPFLTDEQTRVLAHYADEVACIHLGRLNSLASCQAAGKEYHAVPTTFRGDMLLLNFADQKGPFAVNGTLGQLGVATVAEVCNVYKAEKAELCGAVTLNQCPHTPEDKLGALPGRDKCVDYDAVFAQFPEYLNSCANYAAFVTQYDPQFDDGCGFQMSFGSLGSFVNYDTRLRDLCPEQCNYVPEGCPA